MWTVLFTHPEDTEHIAMDLYNTLKVQTRPEAYLVKKNNEWSSGMSDFIPI